MLACTGLAFLTAGIAGLVTGAILIWDLFTTPSKVARLNDRLIAKLAP